MRWPGLPVEAWAKLTEMSQRIDMLMNVRSDMQGDVVIQGGNNPVVTLPNPRGMWVRITGGNNPYSWESLVPQDADTTSGVPFEGELAAAGKMTGVVGGNNPAYEATGNQSVKPNTNVWIEPAFLESTGNQQWVFVSGPGGGSGSDQIVVGSVEPTTCGIKINWKRISATLLDSGSYTVPFPDDWTIGPYVSNVCGEGIVVEKTTKTICGGTTIEVDCTPNENCCPEPSSSSSITTCDIEIVTCYHIEKLESSDGTCVNGGCTGASCIQLQIIDFDDSSLCYAIYAGGTVICNIDYSLTLINSNVSPYWQLQLINNISNQVTIWEGDDITGFLLLASTDDPDPTCDWQPFIFIHPDCCECPPPPSCFSLSLTGAELDCADCTVCVPLVEMFNDANCQVSYTATGVALCGVQYEFLLYIFPTGDGDLGNCDYSLSINSTDAQTTYFRAQNLAYGLTAVDLTFLSGSDTHCDWSNILTIDGSTAPYCCNASSSSSSSVAYPPCYSAVSASVDQDCNECPSCIEVHPDTSDPNFWIPGTRYAYEGTAIYCGIDFLFRLQMVKQTVFPYGWAFSLVIFNQTEVPQKKATYGGYTSLDSWVPGDPITLTKTADEDPACAWSSSLYFTAVCCPEPSSSSSSSGACGVCSTVLAWKITEPIPPLADGTCGGFFCESINQLCLVGAGCRWDGLINAGGNCDGVQWRAILQQVTDLIWTFRINEQGTDPLAPPFLAYYETEVVEGLEPDTECMCVYLKKVSVTGQCTAWPDYLGFCPVVPSPCCPAEDPCNDTPRNLVAEVEFTVNVVDPSCPDIDTLLPEVQMVYQVGAGHWQSRVIPPGAGEIGWIPFGGPQGGLIRLTLTCGGIDAGDWQLFIESNCINLASVANPQSPTGIPSCDPIALSFEFDPTAGCCLHPPDVPVPGDLIAVHVTITRPLPP